MGPIFKKILGIAIGLMIVIGLLTELVPDIATNATALAGDANTPAILAIIVDYWWIGLTIVFIGIIMGTGAGRAVRKIGRVSRRRRR